MSKAQNPYANLLRKGKLFEVCPKAVFAALAVSYASRGGDFLDNVENKVLKEWWILYRNQIVPQKPPIPEPGDGEMEKP